MTKITQTFIIEYEAPDYDTEGHWLGVHNLEMVLNQGAPGGSPYKVKLYEA